jgi:Tol biopolymer transport system component
VEGLAQHDSEKSGFDSFDDIRQMFLRMAFLEDNLLSYNAMGHPRSLTFFYGELGYNQGYAFVKWLSKKYGSDLHDRLARRQSLEYNLTFEKTIERETGVSPLTLFESFKKETQAEYVKMALDLSAQKETGQRYLAKERANQEVPLLRLIHVPGYVKLTTEERRALKDDGLRNNYFKVSPDGRFLSFVKDETLTVINNETFERADQTLFRAKATATKVRSYDWSPDSRSLVVSTINVRSKKYFQGFRFQDLAIVDLSPFIDLVNQEIERKTFSNIEYTITEPVGLLSNFIWGSRYHFITHLSRAEEPAWSPDGQQIAFIKNKDGRKALALYDLAKKNETIVTELSDDSQAGAPTWSPDSTRIAFYLYDGKKQNIWMYSLPQKNTCR